MKKLSSILLILFLLVSCAGLPVNDAALSDQVIQKLKDLVEQYLEDQTAPTPAPKPAPDPQPQPVPDPLTDQYVGQYFIVIDPGSGKYSAAGRVDAALGNGEYQAVIYCEWQAYESPPLKVKPEAHWRWYGSLAEARAYVDSHPETW